MGRRTKQSSSSSFWYSSSRSRSSSAPATPRPEPAEPAPTIGCMSMVHYLIFAPGAGCVGRPPTSSNAVVTPHDCHTLSGGGGDATSSNHPRSSCSKSGFEAPRNSLDLDADNPNEFQIGVQIEPAFDALASRTSSMRRSTAKPTAPSSEAETPRTPSLVARLMGIDGLPDHHTSQSPAAPAPAQHKKTGRRSSTSSTGKENNCCSPPAAAASKCAGGEKKKRVIPESIHRRDPLRVLSCNVGEARSLPDTPRASTSARASWDGPRLSLQALKESVLDRAAHYMSMPSSPTSLSAASSGGKNKKKKKDAACSRRRRRDDDESAKAKDHAREILRQAKETVASRKSNGASSSPAAEKRQMRCFNNKENVVMSSPASAPPPAMADAPTKLRVAVQVHHQTAKPTTTRVAPTKPTSAEHHSPRLAAPLAPRQQVPLPPPHRAKPSRPPPPPPPLDPPPTRARKPDGCERFATRINKKSAACPASTPPPPASSSTTDCCSSVVARVSSSAPLEEEDDPEYSYLRTVLERGGFMRPSPPPRRPWRGHSMSSPVDPIVFHLLELELPTDESLLGPLRHRWNRKLLFHLAQELLASQDGASSTSTGLPLLGKVWKRVRSFPAADCRVVGDIDALVAADLERGSASVRRHPAVEEEAGDVAEDVADRVLDALLAECVAESVSLSCAAAHALSSSRAAAR